MKGKKTGGRTAGTPNKVTSSIKASVLAVFDKIGGDEAFALWASENPTEFYKIASRLVPTEVTAEVDGSIEVRWKS